MHAAADAPHVLVLLATYNGAPWLDELLDSVFGQSGVRVSVLASDDGSRDATLDVLQRHVDAGRALGILPQGRTVGGGACANFIRLLREAPLDGVDAVALCDQDDLWLPGRLERAFATLQRSAAAAYSSDAIAFWADGRRRPLGKAHPQRACDYLFEPAGPGCTYVLSAPLARRLQAEFNDRPDRFVGLGYHDWLIYAYARAHELPWTIDPEAGVLYRQHDSNELGANFGIEGVMRRWGRLTSGWFRGQVLSIAKLLPRDAYGVTTRLERFSLLDRLWLATHAKNLRRRPRDQLALATMLLLGVLR